MSNSNLTEETREHYQNLIGDVGEKYFNDRWMSNPVAKAHYRQTVKAIRHAFTDLPDNLSTLEVGSGPGTWTGLCLEKAGSMKVFDISDEFLKVMKQKYKDESRMKSYVQGDFAEDITNLQGEAFDLIFSGRALEYMTDKSRVVSNCFDHLNDGGQLVIITKNPMWRDKLSSSETKGIHRAQIYWKDLESIFREQGFEDIKVYPAAMGSYLTPFNNKVGIWLSNLVFQLTYEKPMTKRVDSLSESYLISARKPK